MVADRCGMVDKLLNFSGPRSPSVWPETRDRAHLPGCCKNRIESGSGWAQPGGNGVTLSSSVGFEGHSLLERGRMALGRGHRPGPLEGEHPPGRGCAPRTSRLLYDRPERGPHSRWDGHRRVCVLF